MDDRTVRSNPDTYGMASFVAGLCYEHIPGEVIERIKLLMLDSLGCAIFGTGLEWSRILIETLAAVDSSTSCGVWASDRRLSAPHAALVNGTLVQPAPLRRSAFRPTRLSTRSASPAPNPPV